jgi:hypothetical protein
VSDAAAPDPRHVEAIRRLSAAVHRHKRRAGLLVLALAAAGVLANGLRFVPNGEAGVVLRLGRVVTPVASPGPCTSSRSSTPTDRVAIGGEMTCPGRSPLRGRRATRTSSRPGPPRARSRTRRATDAAQDAGRS